MEIYYVEIIAIFLIGLSIGSFINVIVYRLNKKLSIGGRSFCPHCRHILEFNDLVPVISYLFLGGHCRYCHKRISWQYPLVEFITGILFLLTYLKYSLGAGLTDVDLWRDLLVICFLIIIFIYDYKYYLILDMISLPAIFIVLILNLFAGASLDGMFYGILVVGGFFLLQYVISNGKWIGGGDIRLGILMGVILGWPLSLIALFLAYLIGAFIGVILLAVKGKNWSHQVPFGTFLTVGTFLTMIFGEVILSWYLGLM